jgi:hypothetical protein
VIDSAGAGLLLAKAWGILLLIAFVRWTLGPADVVRVVRLSCGWLALPSLALLGLSFAFERWPEGAVRAAFDQRGAWTLSVVVLLGLAWIMHRIARQARNPATELRVLPWL